jgi:hypothetical protein
MHCLTFYLYYTSSDPKYKKMFTFYIQWKFDVSSLYYELNTLSFNVSKK